jgi:peptidyl-prolyl cis-trans isomerase C
MRRPTEAMLVLFLVCIPACQARESDPAGGSSVATATAPAPAAPPRLSPETVVVRVNGSEIRAGQVEQVMRVALARRPRNQDTASPDRLTEMRKQYLESLIRAELLYQASQSAHIQVSETEIDQQLQTLRRQYPSEEDFDQSLRQDGLTLTDMRERIRRNLASVQLVKQQVDDKVKVSDAEIADYYQKNKDKMRRPELVRLSEIFVRVDPRGGPDAKVKGRQKIEMLLKEVRAGKDFATLARTFSESPDASQGGDMGYVSPTAPLPIIVAAAFKLKTGEVSDVVETAYGYHLLKATEKKPAGELPLADAKKQISEVLLEEKKRDALNAYVEKLRTNAKIETVTPIP